MQSYLYDDLNGLIKIETINSISNYYYRIQKPLSINMSNFACKIAFYDINNLLLYHRNDTLAHWLKPWKTINLVLWSKQGNVAYFYEYSQNKVYDSIFLNLKESYCYRIDEQENNFVIVDSLQLHDRAYDEEDIIKRLQDRGLQQHPLIKDKIFKQSFLDNLLKRNKWFP